LFSPFFLWLTRLSACLAVLCVAAVLDVREREVPDRLWLFSSPFLVSLTAISLALGYEPAWPTAVSMLLATAVGLLIFSSGLAGGADAKALIFMAISCPISHVEPLLPSHKLVPLASFSNSLLISAITSIILLVRNVAWKLRTGRSFFEGLGDISLPVKALILISGYKLRAGDLEKARFVFPLEVLVEEDGPRRKLVLVVRLREGEEALGLRRALELGLLSEDDYVWVSPGLPLVAILTAGFVMALVVGDVLFFLVLSALQALSSLL